MLNSTFFNRDAKSLAVALLGKVIRKRHGGVILSARIIETECYYLTDKGSHASLGYTDKRKALFMDGGTIYMYYARGKDSLNISAEGPGNAVLIKGAMPYTDALSPESTLDIMHSLNPMPDGRKRQTEKLCSGQTLLCKSLNIKLTEWDGRNFTEGEFWVENTGIRPKLVIQTTRLGIPKGRDEHLPYRFIDMDCAKFCTSNPLTKKSAEYTIIDYEALHPVP